MLIPTTFLDEGLPLRLKDAESAFGRPEKSHRGHPSVSSTASPFGKQ